MTNTTSAQEWRKDRTGKELTLPSGKVCLVRPVGIEAMLSQGQIPNSLLEIVQGALDKGKGKKKEEVDEALLFAEVIKDPQKLQDVFRLADMITARCVEAPKVRLHTWTQEDVLEGRCPSEDVGVEIPESKRDPDWLYTDEVDLDDKMFIMQFAMGGTRDLERFRSEAGIDVESVPERKRVGSKAKQPARRR